MQLVLGQPDQLKMMKKLKLKINENFSSEREKEFDKLVAISKKKHLTQ
jgi:hypothetical protein